MAPFEKARDQLRSRDLKYRCLDAVQLVKHAFGLVTEARRRDLDPVLVYIYLEPDMIGIQKISPQKIECYRQEVGDFIQKTEGAGVKLCAISYADWLAHWPKDGAVGEHAQNLRERFSIAPA